MGEGANHRCLKLLSHSRERMPGRVGEEGGGFLLSLKLQHNVPLFSFAFG